MKDETFWLNKGPETSRCWIIREHWWSQQSFHGEGQGSSLTAWRVVGIRGAEARVTQASGNMHKGTENRTQNERSAKREQAWMSGRRVRGVIVKKRWVNQAKEGMRKCQRNAICCGENSVLGMGLFGNVTRIKQIRSLWNTAVTLPSYLKERDWFLNVRWLRLFRRTKKNAPSVAQGSPGEHSSVVPDVAWCWGWVSEVLQKWPRKAGCLCHQAC